MSNYYYNEISQHSGDLASFMLDKKYEDTIEKRITLTQSQKYKILLYSQITVSVTKRWRVSFN